MSISSPAELAARPAPPPPLARAGGGGLWLGGPYALLLLVALVLPLAHLVAISVFAHHPRLMFVAEPTLDNYARLLQPYYVEVLLRTLRIGLVTTLLCAALGVPLAYWLARCGPVSLGIGLFLLVMPMMVSTVVRAFGWMIILGRNGLINQISVGLGFERWLFVMNTETAVVIALVQICLPLLVLPTLASIERIPRSLEEAAANLGASPVQLFRRVVLPLAAPGLASGAALAFLVAIGVVVTPALMGGRNSRMVGNEIYDQLITALNWPFASAMAIALIAVVLGALAASRAAAAAVAGRARRAAGGGG